MAVAAIRLIPLKYMAAISLIGCALPKLFHLYSATWEVPALFIALFAGQIAVYGFYAIFIYAHFVSPLRHLPQVKGGLPILGHGISLRKTGPGVMAKKWYATINRP